MTPMGHHRTAERAGNSETPGQPPTPTPTFQIKIRSRDWENDSSKMPSISSSASATLWVVSGGLWTIGSPAGAFLLVSWYAPTSQVSLSAGESASLTWTWAPQIQDEDPPYPGPENKAVVDRAAEIIKIIELRELNTTSSSCRQGAWSTESLNDLKSRSWFVYVPSHKPRSFYCQFSTLFQYSEHPF